MTGLTILLSTGIIFGVYSYLLLASDLSLLIMKLTILFAFSIISLVIAWIGFTMMITTRNEKETN